MPGAVANVAQVHRSLELESQPNNRNMRAPRIRGLHLFSPARVEMGTAHLPKVKQASALRSRPERGANLDRRCALCHRVSCYEPTGVRMFKNLQDLGGYLKGREGSGESK